MSSKPLLRLVLIPAVVEVPVLSVLVPMSVEPVPVEPVPVVSVLVPVIAFYDGVVSEVMSVLVLVVLVHVLVVSMVFLVIALVVGVSVPVPVVAGFAVSALWASVGSGRASGSGPSGSSSYLGSCETPSSIEIEHKAAANLGSFCFVWDGSRPARLRMYLIKFS